jgi:hypothetical protein
MRSIVACLLGSVVFFNLLATQGAHGADGLRVGPCPMSCRTLGIDKRHCRDWREGNTCYVEDTRYSSGNRPSRPVSPPPTPTLAPIRPPSSLYPDRPSQSGPGYEECRRLNRFDISRPYINIARVRPTGNVFGSKYKVFGSVEGMCLVEAGYFEGGRKVSNIPVGPTRDFRRFEFEVTIRGDEFPELRAYTINGDREVRQLDRRDLEGDYRDRREDDRYDRYDRWDSRR